MVRGALSAPLRVTPRPFEIALVTPRRAPQAAQVQAAAGALRPVLIEYRKLISYAGNTLTRKTVRSNRAQLSLSIQ